MSYQEFIETLGKNDSWKSIPEKKEVKEILYAFVKYENAILNAVKDHNKNFLINETLQFPEGAEQLITGLSKGKQMRSLLSKNTTYKFGDIVNNQESFPASEKEFFSKLERDGHIKENNSLTARQKKIIYTGLKKYVYEPLTTIRINNPEFINIMKNFVDKSGDINIEELSNKSDNYKRFNEIIGNFQKGDSVESYVSDYTQFGERQIYHEISPDYVNKLTRINNLYLKPPTTGVTADNVNASAVFESTKKIDSEGRTFYEMDQKSPKLSVFNHLDNGTERRTGRYNIQGSTDLMIVNQFQQAIIDYNETLDSILFEDVE